MVDQEIRVLGDENIIANPMNSQKEYPLTFVAVPNVIVYGRKKNNLNFTVPIAQGKDFTFNLGRTGIIFSDSFNLEEFAYIMVKNPFEEISDFFYITSLEQLDPTGKELNEFNDEVVKWLRRLVNVVSNRCMIFETTLFKDVNNFPNIDIGQTFVRTVDGWTGVKITDAETELQRLLREYETIINQNLIKHQNTINQLLADWKKEISDYAHNVKQYEIVRVVTQAGHGFNFDPVMYNSQQKKFIKATFPHGADGVASRINDNSFKLVWAGKIEIPTTAKDTNGQPLVDGEYYFLGEGLNGGIQRTKPDTYYQHLFQVLYSESLHQNTADILLSVPINQKGKRWDVGEAKTTVNDISELKMQNFPVGKVVEVLGYYTAGDGAGHKRIISTTDDGSGVQLTNGLFANIIHNGEVNVSWFGAKGDGVTDDTPAFKKAIKSSVTIFLSKTYKINSINLKSNSALISLNKSGNIILSGKITLNGNCILDGITIKSVLDVAVKITGNNNVVKNCTIQSNLTSIAISDSLRDTILNTTVTKGRLLISGTVDCGYTVINNCLFKDIVSDTAVYVNSSKDTIQVHNCIIENCTIDNAKGCGILLSGKSHIVKKCNISNITTGELRFGYPIWVHDNDTANISNCFIENCARPLSVVNAKNTNIDKCSFVNCVGEAIFLNYNNDSTSVYTGIDGNSVVNISNCNFLNGKNNLLAIKISGYNKVMITNCIVNGVETTYQKLVGTVSTEPIASTFIVDNCICNTSHVGAINTFKENECLYYKYIDKNNSVQISTSVKTPNQITSDENISI